MWSFTLNFLIGHRKECRNTVERRKETIKHVGVIKIRKYWSCWGKFTANDRFNNTIELGVFLLSWLYPFTQGRISVQRAPEDAPQTYFTLSLTRTYPTHLTRTRRIWQLIFIIVTRQYSHETRKYIYSEAYLLSNTKYAYLRNTISEFVTEIKCEYRARTK